MCWGTDECKPQPFQLDICAFESHTDALFAEADDRYIEQHFHTALITHSGIMLAFFFFDVSSRFSTAEEFCQTERQHKLVWSLRPGRTNNIANFVIKMY